MTIITQVISVFFFIVFLRKLYDIDQAQKAYSTETLYNALIASLSGQLAMQRNLFFGLKLNSSYSNY